MSRSRQVSRSARGTLIGAFLCFVARKAAAAGLTFYMFGADEAENATAVANVQKMHPTLRIVGHSHGYLRGDALRAKVDEINALAPDFLWVALGVPNEQAFVEEYTPLLTNVGVIKTSGGLFNFLSGSRSRAPQWMQRIGLGNRRSFHQSSSFQSDEAPLNRAQP